MDERTQPEPPESNYLSDLVTAARATPFNPSALTSRIYEGLENGTLTFEPEYDQTGRVIAFSLVLTQQ